MRPPHPAVIVLFLVVVWVAISFVIGRASGWAELARTYTLDDIFTGERWSFQSASMRYLMGYNNCLTIGANAQGLFLAIFPLLRVGHSPLWIPWTDISVARKRLLGFPVVELRLGHDPEIPFRVREKLAARLASAAGSAWPEKAAANP